MNYAQPYQDWLELADELNDANVEATLEWFDADFVAAAQVQAAEHGLPWPPSVGDYDRWYANEFPQARHDAQTPETRFDKFVPARADVDDDEVAAWLPATYGP